jgi:rare lipoprotein A
VDAKPIRVFTGKATYYSQSLAGHPMASGELYQPACAQAAHRTLPFGSIARVRAVESGASVVVRIADRGPYAGNGRIIDLSYAAARAIGLIRAGVVDVRVEVLRLPDKH